MQNNFYGIVESNTDPKLLGRVKVRIFGIHSPDRVDQPTDDLPWCPLKMPASLASMSGIGLSPTGILPGSWVTLECIDGDDLQQFIVTGTLIGYQTKSTESIDFGGINTPNEAQSNPAPQPESQTPIDAPVPNNVPSTWQLGDTSKKYESGGKGPGTISPDPSNDLGGKSYGTYQFASQLPLTMANGKARKGWNGAPLQSYLKQSKWGFKFNNVDPASSDFDSIWKDIASSSSTDFAKEQHDYVKKQYYDVMSSKLKRSGYDLSSYGPAVQDLIWSTSVQLGPGKTSVFTDSLSGSSNLSDEDIVTKVSDYKISNVGTLFASSGTSVQASVKSRWIAEKQDLLALCNGQLKPVTHSASSTVQDSTPYDPSNSDNLTVIEKSRLGFVDPSGTYPLPEYNNLPDTNKLAYGEESGTQSEKKTNNRATGYSLPNGQTFDQPQNPYSASYPHNTVFQSKSGHLIEIDDTPNASRINIYHKSGTFIEIDNFGNMVRRTFGADYQIVDKNSYVAIDGRMNVSAGGNVNIMVGGSANIEVIGDTILNCHNDIKASAGGRMSLSASEAIDLKSDKIYIDADSEVHMKTGTTYIQSDGQTNIKSGGQVGIDGSAVYLNSGVANSASSSQGVMPSGRTDFSENVISEEYQTKHDKAAISLETPDEESDLTSFNKSLIDKGIATQDQLDSTPVQDETDQTTDTPDNDSPVTCAFINTLGSIPDSFRLTHNYLLSDLSSNAKLSHYKVTAQKGLTEKEIVCNLYQLATNVLEPIRQRWPDTIVTSGFRTAESSSGTSQHTEGKAADLQWPSLSKDQYFDRIKEVKVMLAGKYDQLLYEATAYNNSPWLHISYNVGNNRAQVFTMWNHKKLGDGLIKMSF